MDLLTYYMTRESLKLLVTLKIGFFGTQDTGSLVQGVVGENGTLNFEIGSL